MKLRLFRQIVQEVDEHGNDIETGQVITLDNLLALDDDGIPGFYKDTPETRKACNEIVDLDKHIHTLQARQNVLYKGLKIEALKASSEEI